MAFVLAAAAIVLVAATAALFARLLPTAGLGAGGLLLIGLVLAELTFGAGLLATRPTTETIEEVPDPFEPAPLPVITPGPTPPPTTTPAPRRRRASAAATPVATPTPVPPASTPPPITEPDPDETPEEDDICPADNPADPDCEDFTPAPP